MVNRRQLLKISALGTASFAAPLAYSASNITMAYNTGNPIGSASPKDLSDNARNLDFLVNGTDESYLDRKGVPRKSWKGMESDFQVAQDVRDASFEAQMAVMGYELPAIPYAGGVTITRITQVIEKDGEFYRAKPGAVPFVTSGSWPTDLQKLVYTGDGVLRTDLARRDAIYVEDFGAVSGDLSASNGDAFRRAFLACAVRRKSKVFGYGNVYSFQNDHIKIPDGITFTGAGLDIWDSKASYRPRKMDRGTTLVFCGTPTDTVTVLNVSNMRVAGGVIANDDYATESMPGNAFYSLLDYTLGDATGAAPATPKPLRVAVSLGHYSHLRDCRVMLNYIGIDGYNSVELLPDFPEFTTSYKGLGDNYDIGVLSHNVMESGVDSVQFVGYWRMAARAVVASNYGDGKSNVGAVFRDSNVFYQGFNGLSIRGNDVHRITALTATTVEVPWNASHTVPVSGTCYLAGTPYAYTSTSKVGDKIVLAGFSVNPSALTTVGQECFFGANLGFAGSEVTNGIITGLGHFTNYRAYDPVLESPFANPSKALEISGSPLRDVEFNNIHFVDTDVFYHLHDALHIGFTGCYAEAQGYSGGVLGAPKGARCIAACRIELPDAHGAYPAGNTRGLVWDATSEMSDGSIDMYPVYRPVAGRFTGSTKYFMPDQMVIEAEGYWPQTWDTKRRYNGLARLFVHGAAGAEGLEIVDSALHRYLIIDASTDRIGLGLPNPGASLHRSGINADCRFQTTGTADPSYQLTNTGGTWSMRTQLSSINQCQFRYNNTVVFQIAPATGSITPGATGVADVGSAGARYNNAYLVNSPNVSSDRDLKQDIGEIPEAWLAAARNIRFVRYKMKAAVAEKSSRGEVARWHIGVIAQEVVQAFSDQGVDAFEIGLVGKDAWGDQYDDAVEVVETVNIDGSITKETIRTGEKVLVREAGEELNIRYEELLSLMDAARFSTI